MAQDGDVNLAKYFVLVGPFPGLKSVLIYPPWNQHSPWKWMVWRLVSFWDDLFSGAMLVLARVYLYRSWMLNGSWSWVNYLQLRFDQVAMTSSSKSPETPIRREWTIGRVQKQKWTKVFFCFLKSGDVKNVFFNNCSIITFVHGAITHQQGSLSSTHIKGRGVICCHWRAWCAENHSWINMCIYYIYILYIYLHVRIISILYDI